MKTIQTTNAARKFGTNKIIPCFGDVLTALSGQRIKQLSIDLQLHLTSNSIQMVNYSTAVEESPTQKVTHDDLVKIGSIPVELSNI